MKKTVVGILPLLVISCATMESTKPAFGPNGGLLHPVDCVEPIDKCYIEAIKICQNGYNVIEATESPTISFDSGLPLLAKRYSLQIECKK